MDHCSFRCDLFSMSHFSFYLVSYENLYRLHHSYVDAAYCYR